MPVALKVVKRAGAGVLGLSMLLLGLTVVATAPVVADTAPPIAGDPTNPATVSADPLPTVQVDGVVWTQLVVGNTVYVGGDFDTARPAGSAPGTNTVPRANLLAYDIRTGELLPWAPTTNGEVLALAASPDQSRIYVGGRYTQVNGVTKNRIVALNPTTGAAVNAFNVSSDAPVYTIVPTATTVYFGGSMSNVNGIARTRAAAVRATDGVVLDWAPNIAGGRVNSMLLSPDGTRLYMAGHFTSVNGSSNPGYGLAAVQPSNAANLSFPGNAKVRNGGPDGAITKIVPDGDSFYATGYTFGRAGGNLEGAARFDWSGNLVWVEDCHGDTYSSFPIGDVVYTASHAHYCGNLPGGFGQSEPWSFYRANAFTKLATGTLYPEYHGYPNWAGTPSPSLLAWQPRIDSGTFTGQNQGAWDVSGNSDYLVAGGEFPRVGDSQQQGLVRFAKRSLAPNAVGPLYTGVRTNPTLTSPAAGEMLVCWETNWDRDNEFLTYKVIKNSNTANPVHTVTVSTRDWNRPYKCFRETGLTPGPITYRLFAVDPLGNESRSETVRATVSGTGPAMDTYAQAVTADGPMHYWRFDEATGTAAADYTGRDASATTASVTRGTPGAIPSSRSATFSGASGSTAANKVSRHGPFWFTVEAWVKTTTTRGGKIVGYGNSATGASSQFDRHLWMGNTGRISFGVRMGSSQRVVSGPNPVNDGQWHHLVGAVGDKGMTLYIDGQPVAANAEARSAWSFNGFWRIGGDNLTGWPLRPTSDYFSGAVDEVAVYRNALTAKQVLAHYQASKGVAPNQKPVAGFTSSTDELTVAFDSSTSTDADGAIVSRSWDFGDGTSSTEAKPTHVYSSAGTFSVTLTVTDDDGETGTVTKNVRAEPPAPPGVVALDEFERSVSSGWGSATNGGAWAVSGSAGKYNVAGGVGTMTIAAAGANARAGLLAAQVLNSDSSVDLSLDKLANGGGIFLALGARHSGDFSSYRAKTKVAADGRVTLSLVRVVGAAETTLSNYVLPATAATYATGERLRLRYQVQGQSPTTLRAKVWEVGSSEPADWQATATDSDPALQVAGGTNLWTYLSGSATNVPISASFDSLKVSELP